MRPYNDLAAVRQLFEAYPGQIAGVIVEPIAANIGFVLPADGFLAGLQALCRQQGALFILDEVMTGFRAALGGAQALWGLDPDLTCLGKVIGGGLPVGAYAGKRAIMETVAPAGPMYQAGTLSGNPLAMTAGLVTLRDAGRAGRLRRHRAHHRANLLLGIEAAAGEYEHPSPGGLCGHHVRLLLPESAGRRHHQLRQAKEYADPRPLRPLLPRHAGARCLFCAQPVRGGFRQQRARQPGDSTLTLDAVRNVFEDL